MTQSSIQERIYTETREELKVNLARCTDGQRLIFKRMYAGGKLDLHIDKVVDNMKEEKLDWASQQVQRTLDKKKG